MGATSTQRHHLNPSELYGTTNDDKNNMVDYASMSKEAAAPNTERPNAQSIEMRIAMHV